MLLRIRRLKLDTCTFHLQHHPGCMSNCTAAHSCIDRLFVGAASPLEDVLIPHHTSLFSDSRSIFNFCLSIAFSSSVTLCISCQGHKVIHNFLFFFSFFFFVSVKHSLKTYHGKKNNRWTNLKKSLLHHELTVNSCAFLWRNDAQLIFVEGKQLCAV